MCWSRATYIPNIPGSAGDVREISGHARGKSSRSTLPESGSGEEADLPDLAKKIDNDTRLCDPPIAEFFRDRGEREAGRRHGA